MNSTDRYAFIALLFLVVVVAVAAFWDDGDDAPVHAGEGEGTDRRIARVEEPALPTPERRGRRHDGGREQDFALNGVDDDVQERSRVSTVGQNAEGHSTDPQGAGAPGVRDPYELAGGPGVATDAPPLQPLGNRPLRPVAGGNAEFTSRPVARPGSGGAIEPRAEEAARPTTRPAAPAPTATPEPTPAPGGDLRKYVVRAGDSLSVIASQQCGTQKMMHEIARLNGLADVDSIKEGMTLELPARVASSAPAPIPTTTSPEIKTARADGHPVVTIKPGQTLSELLYDRYGTYKSALPLVKALNPDLDPDRVQAGQPIVLPHFEDVAGASRPTDSSVAPSASSQPSSRRSGNYVR